MDALEKKINKIHELLAKIGLALKTPSLPTMPSMPKTPSTPKAPSVPSTPKMPKLPGVAPKSNKNPMKIAEQKQDDPQVKTDLANAKVKDAGQWQEKLKMSKNGQWSLTKKVK